MAWLIFIGLGCLLFPTAPFSGRCLNGIIELLIALQGVFEVGEEVKCLVMGLDPGYTNISLSIAGEHHTPLNSSSPFSCTTSRHGI